MTIPRAICKKYLKVAHTMTGQREALFTRLRCKQWTCDPCAALNASIWRMHLKTRLHDISQEWYLVTLTAASFARTELASLANIRDHLERFFKRIKRTFGHIEYVRVYERHPTSKAIHAHLIMTGLKPFVSVKTSNKGKRMTKGIETRKGRKGTWTVRTWFKKVAQECKMGYIVDVRQIVNEVERAIWYVTKYLTKALQDLHVRGLRHIQVSQGVGSPETPETYEWETAAYITSRTFPAGTKVLDVNTGITIDNNYWETKGFYPDE